MASSNVTVTKWERMFPKSPKRAAKKAQRRIHSHDSYSTKHQENSNVLTPEATKLRSLSIGSSAQAQLMHPLNFETIDLGNTPLSSLRSCSEFNRNNFAMLDGKIRERSDAKSSVFTKMFGWLKKKDRGNRRQHSEEQRFFVDTMRPSTAIPPTIISTSSIHVTAPIQSRQSDLRSVRSSRFSEAESIISHTTRKSNSTTTSRAGPKKPRRSLLYESSLALDILFGIGSGMNRRGAMEIELQDMKTRHIQEDSLHDLADLTGLNLNMGGHDVNHHHLNLGLDLNLIQEYNEGFANIGSPVGRVVGDQPIGAASPLPGPTQPLSLYVRIRAILALEFWRPLAISSLTKIAGWSRAHVMSPADEQFYETIRIQPFASGAYLRGMLMSGFACLFFNAYSLVLWPHSSFSGNYDDWHGIVEMLLYCALIFQFVCNLIQLPLRIQIHYTCWESSRAVEVDAAIALLRVMVRSDCWAANRGMGRVMDITSVVFLICGELYLLLTSATDPLRSLFVSLCATCLLAFVVRMILATIFSISMHDPQVLSDARRRGLSRLDLEVLPTFVFTHPDEVNNLDCSICLCGFDMGEMLISLPCDRKHSFHACCIRQWLQRQNSCPLCQKLV